MNMIPRLLFCLGPLAGLAGVSAQASDAPRPNILYFYVDDMGWGSIGPNGQAARRAQNLPSVRTPNLDRLAAHGINFTRGYGCHVCSPARSSQQSGFHQGHTFADRNDPDNAKKAMRADDILMGDALSAAGYVTGYWGKWGYGGSKDRQHPVIQNVQTLPTSHGYQYVLAELHHVRAHTFFQPTLWSAPAAAGAIGGLQLVPNSLSRLAGDARYPATPAHQNHPDYPTTSYCDDAYAFAALDFVRAQAQNYRSSGQPFFGLLAVQIPHAPFAEISQLPNWDEAYRDVPGFEALSQQTQQWAAMVTRIDAHFGNILQALEDPNGDGDNADSVARDTLVVFQSDNGGPAGRNNVELAANGGLRGTKGKIQEGGIRVPLVMRWPRRITSETKLKAGTNTDLVVDVTDLLPTFCELAGTAPPLGIDGHSIAPTLTGTGTQRRRAFIIHEAGNGQSIIRGDEKLVRDKQGSVALYDLREDPRETHDLAKQYPQRTAELKALLLAERVTEPKGFANTYHHFTGPDNSSASRAHHWSDYRYSNAGITYLEDAGAPRDSWIARIENTGETRHRCRVDRRLSVLGLEVRGNPQTQALQFLSVVGPTGHLHGRNEVRIGPGGVLLLQDGTVSSLRWTDVLPGGILRGNGLVEGTLINQGLLEVVGQRNLTVRGDYHQDQGAKLSLPLRPGFDATPLEIDGTAHVAGTLHVTLSRKQSPQRGQSYTVLQAKRVQGAFASAVADDGTHFEIQTTATAVTLTAK